MRTSGHQRVADVPRAVVEHFCARSRDPRVADPSAVGPHQPRDRAGSSSPCSAADSGCRHRSRRRSSRAVARSRAALRRHPRVPSSRTSLGGRSHSSGWRRRSHHSHRWTETATSGCRLRCTTRSVPGPATSAPPTPTDCPQRPSPRRRWTLPSRVAATPGSRSCARCARGCRRRRPEVSSPPPSRACAPRCQLATDGCNRA